MAQRLLELGLIVIGLFHAGCGQAGQPPPLCGTNTWTCQSNEASGKMKQIPSYLDSDTCICVAMNVKSPSSYVQACLNAKGFPVDIRSEYENKFIVGYAGQIKLAGLPPPFWIGLTKNTSNVDIWNDQCTNSTPAAFKNYDGGAPSSITGAAYSFLDAGTWKGNAPGSTTGATNGICRKDNKPCGRNLCQSGSTCVPKGNCFTCTCRPGYTGQYCENAISGNAVEPPLLASTTTSTPKSTTPTAPTTPGTLPSCSISGGVFPMCIPDEIETGCDGSGMIPLTCIPKTTTTTTTTTTSTSTSTTTTQQPSTSTTPAPARLPPYPAPQRDQPLRQGKCECETWVQCHMYWVILATFAAGTMLIAIIGLMYSFFCKKEPTSRIDPVYPMHEPPPPIA